MGEITTGVSMVKWPWRLWHPVQLFFFRSEHLFHFHQKWLRQSQLQYRCVPAFFKMLYLGLVRQQCLMGIFLLYHPCTCSNVLLLGLTFNTSWQQWFNFHCKYLLYIYIHYINIVNILIDILNNNIIAICCYCNILCCALLDERWRSTTVWYSSDMRSTITLNINPITVIVEQHQSTDVQADNKFHLCWQFLQPVQISHPSATDSLKLARRETKSGQFNKNEKENKKSRELCSRCITNITLQKCTKIHHFRAITRVAQICLLSEV